MNKESGGVYQCLDRRRVKFFHDFLKNFRNLEKFWDKKKAKNDNRERTIMRN